MTRSFNYQDLIVVNTLVDSKKTPENFTDRVSFEYSSPGLTCRHKHPMTRLFCRSGFYVKPKNQNSSQDLSQCLLTVDYNLVP